MTIFKLSSVLFLWTSLFSVNLFSDSTNHLASNMSNLLQNSAPKNSVLQLKYPINRDKNISLVFELPGDFKRGPEGDIPGTKESGTIFYKKLTFLVISSITGIFNDDPLNTEGPYGVTRILSNIINSMKQRSEVTILENGKENHSEYQDGYHIVKRYYAQKGKTYVAFVYVVCGPHDVTMLIYTLELHGSETVESLTQKLKEAMKTQVRIDGKSS